MKTCKKCNTTKDIKDFNNRKDSRDGKDIYCKKCKYAFRKQWISSPDVARLQKEKHTTKSRERYAKNPIQRKLANNKWQQNNREKISEYHKLYLVNNREKINAYQRQYAFNRKKQDINFKMRANLRSRVSIAIVNNQKSGSAIKDLGCSIEELKLYLESKFQTGMSWENYGEWEIDHIKPLSAFDLSDREQFKQACHYTNLQPMWWQQNITKSNKTI